MEQTKIKRDDKSKYNNVRIGIDINNSNSMDNKKNNELCAYIQE